MSGESGVGFALGHPHAHAHTPPAGDISAKPVESLPWCLRCPKGHSSLRGHGGDSYECETCSRTFSGKPIDARSVDGFPVDIEEIEEDVIP